MPISQTTTLSKPTGDHRVPVWALEYMAARNRARLYDIVLAEFDKSGLSQATLARRLGKRPEVVSRFLAAPGNWELDSVSDYLFAINGGEADYPISYPLEGAARNDTKPTWLTETNSSIARVEPRFSPRSNETRSAAATGVFLKSGG